MVKHYNEKFSPGIVTDYYMPPVAGIGKNRRTVKVLNFDASLYKMDENDIQKEKKVSLVSGYIKQQEKELKLSMIITLDIVQLIIKIFSMSSMLFCEELDEELFTLSKDKTLLKIKTSDDFSNFMIYADPGEEYQDGINRGVHFWSVKAIEENWKAKYVSCTRAMGIITEKKMTEITNINDESVYGVGFGEFNFWKVNEIFTVKLDCNLWNVTFYRNDEMIEMMDIKKDKYFIALCCSVKRDQFCFEIVDTPEAILFTYNEQSENLNDSKEEKTEMEKDEKETKNLNVTVESLKNEIIKEKSISNEYQVQNELLRKEIDTIKASNIKYKMDVEAKDEEIDKLKKEIATLRQEMNAMRNKMKKLDD